MLKADKAADAVEGITTSTQLADLFHSLKI